MMIGLGQPPNLMTWAQNIFAFDDAFTYAWWLPHVSWVSLEHLSCTFSEINATCPKDVHINSSMNSVEGRHVGFLESTCIKLDRLCYESLFTYVLQSFYTPHTTTFVTFCMRSRREHHESLWGDTAGRCVPFSSFVGLIVLRQQLCWDAKHTALGERSERQPTGDGGDGFVSLPSTVSRFSCFILNPWIQKVLQPQQPSRVQLKLLSFA